MDGAIRISTGRSLRQQLSSIMAKLWWLYPLGAHNALLLAATLMPLIEHPSYIPHTGNLWLHWDSLWFVSIGKYGYTHLPGISKYKSVAFFPLVPLLVHMFSPIGVIAIEQITLIGTLILLKRLAANWGLTPAQTAVATWLFALNPCSIFFSTIYAGPWTIFTTLVSLHFGSKRKWGLAAVFGGMAALTTGTGILVGIFPLVLFFSTARNRDWKVLRGALIWGGGCALGLGLYMGYLWYLYHNPLAFAAVQGHLWHSYWRWPWYQFIVGFEHIGSPHYLLRSAYEGIALIYVAGATLFVLGKGLAVSWQSVAAQLYVVAGLVIAFSFYPGHNPFSSALRLVSIYFPAYIGLASRLPKWMVSFVLIAFVGIAYIGTAYFTHGYFFQ